MDATTKPRSRRGQNSPTLAEVKQAYDIDGLDIRAIADRFDISYGKAHAMVHEARCDVRPRGGYRPRKPVDDDEEL